MNGFNDAKDLIYQWFAICKKQDTQAFIYVQKKLGKIILKEKHNSLQDYCSMFYYQEAQRQQ